MAVAVDRSSDDVVGLMDERDVTVCPLRLLEAGLRTSYRPALLVAQDPSAGRGQTTGSGEKFVD